ncbi:hypothetical protein SAMN05443245_3388 [Paraburkholderia fungorum]|uniref:Uncharacterized protein n=1 Tax=Paraburkholderia fungorum TaxID=134537 RepID=A0A1H1GYT3_9BURK|nr:hypothetical protein [Paraburkholderia fungorum]SDR18354.1 hypothetical protein SAMN05443245_3388 [Paraburkholderia fungorum]
MIKLTGELRSHLKDAAAIIRKHHPAISYAARAIEQILDSESAVVLDGERAADYRVGWFKSSSDPLKRVRCLFEGGRIAEAEKHHSFIEWCDARAASPQATATQSDANLRKLVIGVREFILGYLHGHVKDWPAPYDHLRSDAVTEILVTDARDQMAAAQPASGGDHG